MAEVTFLVPGELQTPTGGYGYDRRLIRGLTELGWDVRVERPLGGWPFPDVQARFHAARILSALPDGALVLADGLAFGAMAEEARAESERLRLVALVHHPLGDESGLSATDRDSLVASERAALNCARAVVCTSAATGRRLIGAFGVPPQRLTVAPPGTDPGERSPGNGDPPRIVSVGSLIPRKRHDILISALASLSGLSWTARIIGSAALDPACAAGLRSQIEVGGLSGRIDLCGSVTDTRAELARADLFALASEYEGYGMAFAEALSQGVPVVACRAGAIAELVPEAAGGLALPGDAAAFAATLAPLIGDALRRRSAADAAFAAGRNLPSWSDTARSVAAVLAQARQPG